MLNIRKRFFLLLTIIGLIFITTACTASNDYVKVSLDSDEYVVKVGQTLEVKPIINKGSEVGELTFEYSSSDDQVATYVDGNLTGLQVGEVVIRVVCVEKAVAYDTAVVKVVKDYIPDVEFGTLPESIYRGESTQLTYQFIPEYAEASVTFSSANPDVAVVDENGVITGTGMGTAVICVRVADIDGDYRDYTFSIIVEEADYAINYELDGGENNPENPDIYNVLILPIELKEPTKLGYKFLGWYLGEEKVDAIEKGIEGEITLTAKWELIEYTISYDFAGGNDGKGYASREEMVDDFLTDALAWIGKTNKPDGMAENKGQNPTTVGFANVFSKIYGFFDDAKYAEKWAWVKEYILAATEDESIKGSLEAGNDTFWRYSVGAFLFKEQSTAWPKSEDFRLEEKANGFWSLLQGEKTIYNVHSEDFAIIQEAFRDGYTFLGWYLGEDKVESIKTGSTGDLTLTAKWEIIEYTIELDYANMPANPEYPTTLKYTVETGVELPTPAHSDWTFLGWFEGSEKVEEVSLRDASLKAKWYNPNANLPINYVMGEGGKLPEGAATTYVAKDGLAELPAATKPGYTFLGWFANEACTEAVTSIEGGQQEVESVTLYAAWEVVTFNIEYELNGGRFVVDEIVPLYDSFEALTTEFINDYSALYNLTDVTAASFYGKSNKYGLYSFFKNEEMSAKWGWLLDFIYEQAQVANYTGKAYLLLTTGAANFNKYARVNFAAFLQQTRLTSVSPASMSFADVDSEALWAACPTKEIQVGIDAQYTYTVEELPLQLATPVKEGLTFVGWSTTDKYRDEISELPAGTVGDVKLYAKWSDMEAIYETQRIIYVLNNGRFEGEYEDTFVETQGLDKLPTPVKVGYTFLGWTLEAESAEYVTSIGKEVEEDVTLYAQWAEKEASIPKIIYVGPEREYKTLDEAMKNASKGDTIVLDAGTYLGGTVTKSVTIKGPNADINPNIETRKAEAIITGDIIIAADNVVINGINLDDKGRIKTDDTQSINGLALSHILVTNNSHSSSSTTAFDLTVNASYVVSNVSLTNSRVEEGTGRQMVMITNNIHNLTIDNNEFYATYSTFNDAIKLANAGTSGVTGDLVITNNYFQDFAQYMIWIIKYGAVNVELSNNEFKHIGQSAGTHAIIRFATYTGTESDKVTLNMTYNTLTEGYMVLRIDAADKLSADNALFVVNYNNVISTSDTTLIKNSSTAAVVKCNYNYWGVDQVDDEAFVNATHTNDLGTAEDIPSEEEAFISDKLVVGEGQTYATIADALAVAQEGASIYLMPGSYAEEVTIKVANLTIYGPNHGVAGTAERSVEAILTAPIVVEAAGFTLDGVQLDNGSYINVKANNAKITNVHSVSATFAKSGSVNRTAVIVTNAKVSSFELSNSYFNTGEATYLKGVFSSDSTLTNAKFVNNYFTHESLSQTLSDTIAIYNAAGVIEFIGNVFEWVTDDWCIMLGSTSANVERIDVINNTFIGRTVAGTDYYTCGLMLRQVAKGGVVNVIHNYFGYLTGTIISGRYSKAGSEYNIKYNIFDQTSYRQDKYAAGSADLGAGAFNYEGNYYGKPLPSQYIHATDYGTVTDKAVCDDLYAAWKVLQEIGTPEVYSNLSYELNGGEIADGYDVKYLEGQKVALYSATREGFEFLGWSLDEAGTKCYFEIQKDWVGDIKLYAQWVEIFDLTYELNGGECDKLVESVTDGTEVQLPTPEKYGHVFLGWSLTEEATEYVSKITVTADTKLYANWFEATFFYVTYELNGGSVLYASRDELIADWLKDYNLVLGKNYATAADINGGSFADIDYHTFLASSTELSNGQKPLEKWKWLVEYLYQLSVRDVASNNCNVLGLKEILDKGEIVSDGDNKYGVSYAFRAFLKGTTIRPGTSYTSVDHSVYENANGFWGHLSKAENNVYGYYEETVLPEANLENYKFDGWYRNADFSGEPVTVVNHEIVGEGLTLYAKFIEATPVESVTINNKFTEIKRFETAQLEWTIAPAEANIQTVKFVSSNPEVATIDDKGFITAITNGTTTITITSQSSSGASDSFTFEVYSPDHFDASYDTESYVAVDGTIKLLAEFIKRDGTTSKIVWSSLNGSIASVDENGIVTGQAEGLATIRASLDGNSEVYFDFVVTVLSAEMSAELKEVVEAHESNAFVRYDLGIGSGTPAYYSDIFGSVSKLLYNHKLEINDQFRETGNASKDYYENSNKVGGVVAPEFITVHYTAGFDASADTDNHADYFTSGASDTSIHYVTGNAGNGSSGGAQSEVYATLDHAHGAWHAGDSNARYYSNSTKKNANNELVFVWMPTGVKYDNVDLMDVKWSASNDFYFEINGQKTTIKLPSTYDYKERGTTHIYNADGTISSTETFNGKYSWAKIDNRPVEEYFNNQGFPVKVIDGEYYMGPTWWSFGQNVAGMICGSGGNMNSIGIESCVNAGSDLWYTWQVTAQLVASLMVQYDLDATRVKGHHFFDGKDCPQPLLENDLEIWWEFMQNVEHEYRLLTTFKDTTFELEVDEEYSSFISENGRVVDQPEFTQVVTYTVTVTTGDKVETITLATAVEGMYNK